MSNMFCFQCEQTAGGSGCVKAAYAENGADIHLQDG